MIQDRTLLLAIGTNSHSWNHIRRAKRPIQEAFPSLVVFSSIVVTAPIGIDGKSFRNCLATMLTDLSFEEVNVRLKQIETLCDNSVEKRAQGIVEMDIDILLHKGKRYHEKDWERPYIHQLLPEILPTDFIFPNRTS